MTTKCIGTVSSDEAVLYLSRTEVTRLRDELDTSNPFGAITRLDELLGDALSAMDARRQREHDTHPANGWPDWCILCEQKAFGKVVRPQ